MDEYIKKQDVLQRIESDDMWNRPFSVLYGDIEEMTHEDVTPVRHGRWEWDTEDIYRCSNCAEKSHVKEVMGYPDWDYCPNCGAKMDGGENNDKP